MTYSVDSVVCDYGVYENVNGNRRLCVICNSRANALLVADILNKDYEHQIADMKENIYGNWILDESDNSVTCDTCGCQMYLNDIMNGEGHFCPNCNADMRGSRTGWRGN